ncbi:tetratricopeptide repeat protein [Jannaschia sp. Os4]|uniref:tetratricopeptide repeat protein n=1 Tax=Jannaschia sp. Os4 TaxID=2807617 RepID=UPI00193A6CF3|nr:tetratricopeptide repeat protein [Jannaschia sp. Os4]MBM2577242.1 tetratricopeptide repeat protein [Jannaschia sp. Os4]
MRLSAALLAATLLLPAPLLAQTRGEAGPYLAARIAGFASDYAAAAEYYDRLVARDDTTPSVLENAVIVNAALGDFAAAARVADLLEAAEGESQFADAARLIAALEAGDWDGAEAILSGETVGGALLDGLVRGWIAAARGDGAAARAEFDRLAETEGFTPFALIHTAYLAAMEGDFETADEIFSGRAGTALQLTARGIEGHAQVLAAMGRTADAVDLLTQSTAAVNSPALEALLARIEAGEEVGFDLVATPRDGMAEAYFTLAALLAGEASPTFVLINGRAATVLRPDHTEALVLVAALLDDQGQSDLAAAALRAVPRDDPAFHAAEIERADVLLKAGREEAAVEVLQALTRTDADRQEVWASLGDALRRTEDFVGAAEAYDRALSIVEAAGEPEARDWFLYYARGIARERTDDWAGAEADFRRALDLNPDQPSVLNYLGYGLVEQRMKLDEALDMIERAVAARPNDGYITDSLGWVLYRLGRAEEAVAPMERAVELTPRDPVINDHLGDVLWTVGRKREAEFQWRRALSLDPEPEDLARIKRKLEVGLDAVLDEEGGVGVLEEADDG